MVYIREAHAIDGRSPSSTNGGPLVEDPLHLGERRQVARECRAALELEDVPGLVDDVDDAVSRAYQAWPDRLVLVDTSGVVAYQSAPGPWGFDVKEFEAAIRDLVTR